MSNVVLYCFQLYIESKNVVPTHWLGYANCLQSLTDWSCFCYFCYAAFIYSHIVKWSVCKLYVLFVECLCALFVRVGYLSPLVQEVCSGHGLFISSKGHFTLMQVAHVNIWSGFDLLFSNIVVCLVLIFLCPIGAFFALCGLRGCKNWPAPFPGRMSYKATKPGLALSVVYLSMFYCIVVY